MRKIKRVWESKREIEKDKERVKRWRESEKIKREWKDKEKVRKSDWEWER